MNALDRAINQIHREFGPAFWPRARKASVRWVLHAGTGHPAVRARYGALARKLHEAHLTLGEAVRAVEGWREDERPGHSRMVLGELLLILRYARRQRSRHILYRGILSLMVGG